MLEIAFEPYHMLLIFWISVGQLLQNLDLLEPGLLPVRM